jgi:hypothetical protein
MLQAIYLTHFAAVAAAMPFASLLKFAETA